MSWKSVVEALGPTHFVYDNLVDEAAGGNDLTAVGATRHTTDTPGDGIPDYWEFDGVDDYLHAADAAAFDIAGQFTVVWWVRRDASAQSNSFANFFSKGDATGVQARLNGTDIDSLRLDVRNTEDSEATDDDGIPAAATWYMRAVRYAGSFVRVLLISNTDGAVTVGASDVHGANPGTNDLDWVVGAQNDTGSNIRRFWRGDITPPIIFATALSDADLTSIWDAKDDADAGTDYTETPTDDAGVTDAVATAWVASLAPTADATTSDLENEADALTPLWSSIDDDPDSPNDADWINNRPGHSVGTIASGFFPITDLPAGFGNADTAEIEIRWQTANMPGGGAGLVLYARLFRTDETTPLSNRMNITSQVTTDQGPTNTTVVFTGLDTAAGKTVWDNAKLYLEIGGSQS